MSKAAIVILAGGDTPESLGRVVNGLTGALEFLESGSELRVVFDGAGTRAAAALAKSDHKYHALFEKVRSRITGICSYCASAYKVKDEILALNLPLAADFKDHPSFKRLIDDGFVMLTF